LTYLGEFCLEEEKFMLTPKQSFTLSRTVKRSTRKCYEFSLVIVTYIVLSTFFLFGVITSNGDVAQQDWDIPLTVSDALNSFYSTFFAWEYNGFGSPHFRVFTLPYFLFLNAALAPLGFVGGTEIKILSVSLVALAGISTYTLSRSLGLKFFPSFLSGLFFMTTPVVFDYLMFGWIYYLIAYDFLPIMILVMKKFLETGKIYYALVSGIILSIAMEQPAFILVYPSFTFLFVVFESRSSKKLMVRGLLGVMVSLVIWFLTALHFLGASMLKYSSFYYGEYYYVMKVQFSHLQFLLNPIRLWGSTFNYQFETYFPKELILFSFMPIFIATMGAILNPHERRAFFLLVSYLLYISASYYVYNNLDIFVYNLPYGAIFEPVSIFLVPACLSLALLIGYTDQALSSVPINFHAKFRHLIRNFSSTILLILIVLGGIPWWMGETSGNVVHGPPSKLNLYKIPLSYIEWAKYVTADDKYFVIHIPSSPNVQILNTTYFSLPYEGIDFGGIIRASSLPYVSTFNTSLLLNELFDENSEIGEKWGNLSIKYIVVYTNVKSTYDINAILNRLSRQKGIAKIVNLTEVIVYENKYAKPVVYADNSNVAIKILHHDPTSYKIIVNATSPFHLILNQAYSSDWLASINGTVLLKKAHNRDINGFNKWYINYTGTMTVDIYYAPQTIWLTFMLFSYSVVAILLFYLIFITVSKER
jgi:hypothetical protein